MALTYRDLIKAIRTLEKNGCRPKALYLAGIFPDGKYRIMPIPEAVAMFKKTEQQKKAQNSEMS